VRSTLLFAGVAVWLVGALTGEAMAFIGMGLCALALIPELSVDAVKSHWRGLLAWVAYSALSLASASWALKPWRSGAPWSALHWAFFPLAVLALRRITERQRVRLLDVFCVVAIISAIACVIQHFVPVFDHPWLRDYFTVQRVLEPADNGGFKAGGLHFHRLRYAHTLVPLFFALAPDLWRSRRVLGGITLALSLVGLSFTYTRASWVAVAFGILAFPLSRLRERVWVRAELISFTPLLIPLLSFVGLDKPADRSFAWHNAIELFKTHPIFGVGYGGYPQQALSLNGGVNPTWTLIHLDAHSLLLQFFAEQGVVGLILWLLMAVLFFLWVRPATASTWAVIAVFSMLGVVHNWAFHPVVVAAAAFAIAWRPSPLASRDPLPGGERVTSAGP